MRSAFASTLSDLAEVDSRIWLLTGDLGYSVLEGFRDRIPERYVNVGVAEQNMSGIAAGIAHGGGIVFTYSIANFPTFRCLEQIRNDICYHDLPVKIVSVGAGYAYGAQGYTHHGVEDLAVLRALPGMTVVAPGDPLEAQLATRALVDLAGPCYLRLGKGGEPSVHTSPPDFVIGKAIPVRDGADVTLISTGGVLRHTLDVAEQLASEHHLEARVLSMHTVKPLDTKAVCAAVRETAALVTVEEHSVTGGLGSAVADVLAGMEDSHPPLRKFGLPDRTVRRIGGQEYLRRVAGDLQALVLEACGQEPHLVRH